MNSYLGVTSELDLCLHIHTYTYVYAQTQLSMHSFTCSHTQSSDTEDRACGMAYKSLGTNDNQSDRVSLCYQVWILNSLCSLEKALSLWSSCLGLQKWQPASPGLAPSMTVSWTSNHSPMAQGSPYTLRPIKRTKRLKQGHLGQSFLLLPQTRDSPGGHQVLKAEAEVVYQIIIVAQQCEKQT